MTAKIFESLVDTKVLGQNSAYSYLIAINSIRFTKANVIYLNGTINRYEKTKRITIFGSADSSRLYNAGS